MKTATMAQARQMARDEHGSDEIEIDDNDNPKMSAADFSQGEDGCWVRAWVWVPNIEVEGWQKL